MEVCGVNLFKMLKKTIQKHVSKTTMRMRKSRLHHGILFGLHTDRIIKLRVSWLNLSVCIGFTSFCFEYGIMLFNDIVCTWFTEFLCLYLVY